MTIYLITILILFLFAIIEARFTVKLNTSRFMVFMIFFLLIFQTGLRWQTGTDWDAYLNHFNSISDFDSTSPLKNGFEFGYNFFVFLIKLISTNYTVFLIIHSFLYYFLIFKAISKLNPHTFLTLLMIYTLTMGMMGSNRQLIALAICLYAVRYILEKKPIKFFCLITIAITFHTTSFIFALYYLFNRDIKPHVLFAIIVSSLLIGNSQIPLLLFSYVGELTGSGHIASKIFFYISDAKYSLMEYKLTIIGLLKRLFFLFIFYYNRRLLSTKIPYYNILLNGYISGIAIYFLFADSLLILVNRGSLYFNIMEPILLATQLTILKGRADKTIAIIVLLIFSIFFFFQSISTYSDLFIPYKGIFVNSDYYRIMY